MADQRALKKDYIHLVSYFSETRDAIVGHVMAVLLDNLKLATKGMPSNEVQRISRKLRLLLSEPRTPHELRIKLVQSCFPIVWNIESRCFVYIEPDVLFFQKKNESRFKIFDSHKAKEDQLFRRMVLSLNCLNAYLGIEKNLVKSKKYLESNDLQNLEDEIALVSSLASAIENPSVTLEELSELSSLHENHRQNSVKRICEVQFQRHIHTGRTISIDKLVQTTIEQSHHLTTIFENSPDIESKDYKVLLEPLQANLGLKSKVDSTGKESLAMKLSELNIYLCGVREFSIEYQTVIKDEYIKKLKKIERMAESARIAAINKIQRETQSKRIQEDFLREDDKINMMTEVINDKLSKYHRKVGTLEFMHDADDPIHQGLLELIRQYANLADLMIAEIDRLRRCMDKELVAMHTDQYSQKIALLFTSCVYILDQSRKLVDLAVSQDFDEERLGETLFGLRQETEKLRDEQLIPKPGFLDKLLFGLNKMLSLVGLESKRLAFSDSIDRIHTAKNYQNQIDLLNIGERSLEVALDSYI